MLIFPISLDLQLIIVDRSVKSIFPNLVKHFPLELKSISRPDVLQSVQDLLALSILLVSELDGRK